VDRKDAKEYRTKSTGFELTADKTDKFTGKLVLESNHCKIAIIVNNCAAPAGNRTRIGNCLSCFEVPAVRT